MRHHQRFISALLLGMLAAVANAQPVTTRATGVIDGVVADTGLRPLADVTVTIVGTAIRVVTGTNGRFRLVTVPAGPYVLLVRRIGFESATARVQVDGDDTLRVSFALEPAVTSLDTVTVASRSLTPKLADFYERRKHGVGQFLTQDEIEKINAVQASDLFTRFLGIRVTEDGRHAFSRRDTPAHLCPISTVVDGIARDDDFRALPSPNEIAAVEFFSGPSEIPLQYKTTRQNTWCGLILIWTRDGSKPQLP
jgi:CarboxypepD_reg-like domain